jgi:hypothetical protein
MDSNGLVVVYDRDSFDAALDYARFVRGTGTNVNLVSGESISRDALLADAKSSNNSHVISFGKNDDCEVTVVATGETVRVSPEELRKGMEKI